MKALEQKKKKIKRKIGTIENRVRIHFPVEDGGDIELESRDCVEIKIIPFDRVADTRRKKI